MIPTTITTRRGRERAREIWTGTKVAGLSADELAQAQRAGYEPDGEGYFVGHDPRKMQTAQLQAMGHNPISPMQIIRAKCLDCCGGDTEIGAVRKCPATSCPLWPFRMGKNPWRAPPSEAQIAATRSLAARHALKISEPPNGGGQNAGTLSDGAL